MKCMCGCGEIITQSRTQLKRFKRGHAQIFLKNLNKIPCKCGCGKEIIPYNNCLLPRYYFGSHSARGKNNHFYGKVSPSKGIPRTADVKAKIIKARIGKPHPHKRSEIAIAKLIAFNKSEIGRQLKRAQTPWNKNTTNEKYIEKMREKRLHQVFPQKDSKLEVTLQNALTENKIEFKKHQPIMGQPDIFIEPNICIFADGKYWHTLPKVVDRANRVNKYLIDNKYKVLRFSEQDIKCNIGKCISEIKNIVYVPAYK